MKATTNKEELEQLKFDSLVREQELEIMKLNIFREKCSTYEQLTQLGIFDNDYVAKMVFGKEKNKIIKK